MLLRLRGFVCLAYVLFWIDASRALKTSVAICLLLLLLIANSNQGGLFLLYKCRLQQCKRNTSWIISFGSVNCSARLRRHAARRLNCVSIYSVGGIPRMVSTGRLTRRLLMTSSSGWSNCAYYWTSSGRSVVKLVCGFWLHEFQWKISLQVSAGNAAPECLIVDNCDHPYASVWLSWHRVGYLCWKLVTENILHKHSQKVVMDGGSDWNILKIESYTVAVKTIFTRMQEII